MPQDIRLSTVSTDWTMSRCLWRVLAATHSRLVRGYNGTLAAPHPALTKVVTQAQIMGGLGWLGTPLGPASAKNLTGPSILDNLDFERGGASWLAPWDLQDTAPAIASIHQDTHNYASGWASAKITVMTDARLAAWIAFFLFVLSAWPLLLVDLPPFQDLPNHVATAHIVEHPELFPSSHSTGSSSRTPSWRCGSICSAINACSSPPAWRPRSPSR